MPRQLQEITATYTNERFRFGSPDGDTIIGDATLEDKVEGKPSRVAVKCKEDSGEPSRNLTYRFYGDWSAYTNKRSGKKEMQFHARTFVRCEPHGRTGVIAYLAKAPNIGRVIAGRLHGKFGGNAVRVLRERPEVAASAIDRLSGGAAAEAANWLEREKLLEGCTIDLIDLLDGRQFPRQVSKQAVKKYGNRASQLIKANPYLLMQFRGCGFKRADSLYLDLEHNPSALKRQALCAWHAISQQSSGDTWHYVEVVNRSLLGSIAGAELKTARALRLAVRGRLLSLTRTNGVKGDVHWDGDCLWVADERKANSEFRLSQMIIDAASEDTQWPIEVEGISSDISEHQAKVLSESLLGPLAILGGGPGTGKTYTTARLIKALIESFGADQIGIAAPTGKAAVRLSEALDEYGVPLRARTWHSLLGVKQAEDGGDWQFTHDATNCLPYKVLIGDESSMLDTDLTASIFAARAKGTLVLLVGDTSQLPPVGHGAPLRDMIAARLPYGELTEIRRNSGKIVEACKSIREGKPFIASSNEGNLRISSTNHTEDQTRRMIEIASAAENPIWECQVVCAVNKKSDISRRELNQILQAHLNPSPIVSGCPFRVGDKIVNTKNGYFPESNLLGHKTSEDAIRNDYNKIYVANGELARVASVSPKYLIATLESPSRAILIPRGASMRRGSEGSEEDHAETGCTWDLGYALSVHKSQGSEWPIVIVMIDGSAAASRVCTREWIYTAISRAKEACYLVGQEHVAQGFTRRTSLDKRKTFLREMICQAKKRS